MATPTEIMAEIDANSTGRIANIIKSNIPDATTTEYYVVGMQGYAGRSRWVRCTTANTAAQQAAVILAALA